MPDVDSLTFTRPPSMGGGIAECEFSVEHDFDYSTSSQGLQRTATLRCAGDDGPIAADWLQGVGFYRSTNGFPNPQKFPGNEDLRVQSVRGSPQINLRPGPQAVSGEDAILTVNYETLRFDVSGFRNQDFFETDYPIPWSRVESHDTYEQYPVKGVNLSVDRSFNRRVAITEFMIDRGMISDWLGFRTILKAFKNSVNKFTFAGAAPGTMYFAGFSWKPEWDASGLPVQTFRINLREREADWNFVPSDVDLAAWVDYHDFDDPPKRNYVYKDWAPIYNYGIIV